MRIALLLVFIAFPLLELALLIRAGQVLGFWPTLAIVVGTAVLGATLLRRQGLQVLTRLSAELAAGRPPIQPLADGAMLLLAGAFLIAPGLLTDVIGLLLLLPPVRAAIRRGVARRLQRSPDIFADVIVGRRPLPPGQDAPVPRPGRRPSRAEGPVIEGEYERLDNKPGDHRP